MVNTCYLPIYALRRSIFRDDHHDAIIILPYDGCTACRRGPPFWGETNINNSISFLSVLMLFFVGFRWKPVSIKTLGIGVSEKCIMLKANIDMDAAVSSAAISSKTGLNIERQQQTDNLQMKVLSECKHHRSSKPLKLEGRD